MVLVAPSETLSVAAWAQLRPRYALYLSASNRSRETIRTYVRHLDRFQKWCAELSLPMATLSPDQVFSHLGEVAEIYSRSYFNTRLSALKSYLRWLVKVGLRPDDPTNGLPMRQPKPEPRVPFSDDELIRLLTHAESRQEQALVLMLLGSGIRRSELLGMRIEAIDWLRGIVLIDGKGGRPRPVAPGFRAMGALRKHVGVRVGPVWVGRAGKPLTKSSLLRLLRRISARAGVADVFPHRFRTTTICLLLDAGADLISVSTLAGHRALDTTRYYQRAVETKRALKQLLKFNPADRVPMGKRARRRSEP